MQIFAQSVSAPEFVLRRLSDIDFGNLESLATSKNREKPMLVTIQMNFLDQLTLEKTNSASRKTENSSSPEPATAAQASTFFETDSPKSMPTTWSIDTLSPWIPPAND